MTKYIPELAVKKGVHAKYSTFCTRYRAKRSAMPINRGGTTIIRPPEALAFGGFLFKGV